MSTGPRLAVMLSAYMAVGAEALQWELPQRKPAEHVHRHGPPPFRQALQNQGGAGMEYTATITIGSQAVQGVLDTGSYELLVLSTRCTTCGGGTGGYYDDARSSTHEKGKLQVAHYFGSGRTWSQLGFEDVAIGPLHSERQYFWQVVGAELPAATGGGFQAIVGVGPPSTPRSDALAQARSAMRLGRQAKADPKMHVTSGARAAARDAVGLAKEQTLLESFGVLVFSICIRRADRSEGYFTWNDDDPRTLKPGLFVAVPVVGNLTWGAKLTNVRMKVDKDLPDLTIGCEAGCGALLDSGTSLLVVPREAARRALELLDRLNSDCSDLDLLPHLVFELGGVRLSLPPEAYVGQFEGELPQSMHRYAKKIDRGTNYRACELLIMTMDVNTQLGPMWIMGLPFFREYYTTFSLGNNIWDQEKRSLFLAEPDDGCRPRMPSAGRRSSVRGSLRRVDLSKAQFPQWVETAAAAGSLAL